MAEVLLFLENKKTGKRVYREPISAGFIGSNGNCHGNSETLGLDSRLDEDSELLANQIFLN